MPSTCTNNCHCLYISDSGNIRGLLETSIRSWSAENAVIAMGKSYTNYNRSVRKETSKIRECLCEASLTLRPGTGRKKSIHWELCNKYNLGTAEIHTENCVTSITLIPTEHTILFRSKPCFVTHDSVAIAYLATSTHRYSQEKPKKNSNGSDIKITIQPPDGFKTRASSISRAISARTDRWYGIASGEPTHRVHTAEPTKGENRFSPSLCPAIRAIF